ncbi:MAG: hypothetical protein U0637_02700 [Phycisphaerales bacterium]
MRVAFIAAVAVAGSTVSAQITVPWSTVDCGGGTMAGGVYTVSATIGQPDAGFMSGGVFEVTGGFWVGGAAPTGCDSIDFNGDGLFPDTADIDDFLSVFSGGGCSTGTCGDIDFNNDGLFPDTTDIDSLLSVFSGGPCL